MPTGWYGLICCICFEGLTPETCAIDIHGEKWDMCPGQCAKDAGLEEGIDCFNCGNCHDCSYCVPEEYE